MKLSKTVCYALKATLYLGETEQEGPIPSSQLAEDTDLPSRFLLQVMRALVRAGLLKSTRGVEGGYQLARPLDEISLLNLIEAIEGPVEATLPYDAGLDEDVRDQLEPELQAIADDMRERLGRVTLDDFS